MKRLRRIISPIMILLILFSNLQLPYLKSEMNPKVYAAGKATDVVLSDETNEGEASSTVVEDIYGIGDDGDSVSEAIYGTSDDSTGAEDIYGIGDGNTTASDMVAAAMYSDSEAVALDMEWLTMDLIFNGNTYYSLGYDRYRVFCDKTNNFNMPVLGENGSTIIWTSSEEGIIGTDGTVTSTSGGYSVYISATVSKGGSQEVKRLEVEVGPTKDEDVVWTDYEWLQVYIFHNDNFLDDVTEKLNFPFLGQYGSIIEWSSSNTSIIASDGTVNRPSLALGNVNVVITAIISKGEARVSKEFPATVLAAADAAESVALDKEWLNLGRVLNGNRADYVKRDLYLPMWGENGSEIKWSSDNTLIGEYGHVTRPTITQEDQHVILTATISKGVVVDKKIFPEIVIKKDMVFPLALNFDDFSDDEDSLQVNGKSGIFDTIDSYGTSFKVIQFSNERLSSNEGGSVFTRNKLHLEEDMSFSTAFSYKNIYPQNTEGNSGFTFTLQAEAATAYGPAPASAGADGITPSLSIAFNRKYGRVFTGGQSSYFNFSDSVEVFYNGVNDAESNGRKVTFASDRVEYDRFQYNNNLVWIEYNGLSKALEIRVGSTYDNVRPDGPTLKIDNVDLGEIFSNGENNFGLESGQDVYAGFTGSVGNVDDKSEIWDWYFMNNWDPIVFWLDTFIDASNIALSANPPGDQSSSTVTAYVYGRDGSAAAGVTVVFSTDLGSLDSSTAITDASGYASVVLSSVVSGPVTVKVTAAGGSTALTEVIFVLTDEDSVNYDTQWLTDERVLNGNSALDNITKDLCMPLLGRNGSDISWTSSKEGLVILEGLEAGKVNTPSPAEGDQQVVLTAAISKGEGVAVKIFNITVKVLDEDRVSADSNWLTNELVLNGNIAFDNITTDLKMPPLGPGGSNISWTSSNTGVVTAAGTVTSPAFTQGDKAVTLTATITRGSIQAVKQFDIIVKTLDETDKEAVDTDYAWLTDALILNGNSSLSSIKEQLSLPDLGSRESSIVWEATGGNVSIVDGSVSRPTYTQGDTAITLTATITKGMQSIKKTFNLVVIKLPQTIEEAVAADTAWLDASRALGSNLSQYSIINNLVLPASAPEGSSIAWITNMPGVISGSGAVTRPEYLEGHKTVTLTATLTKGAVQVVKTLEYTVLRIPDTTPPAVISTLPVNNSTGVNWETREIVITFSEPIKYGGQGSINNDLHLFNPDYQFTSKRIDNDKLILTLDKDMKFGARYSLGIYRGQITDMSGNSINDHFYYSFTVESKLNSKIEVVSTNPEDRERLVPLKPELSFTYSYSDIVRGSTFDNISLRIRGGEAVPVTRSLNRDEVTLSLEAGAELKPGTVYEMSIPAAAVRDRFKNDSSAKTIQFVTQGDDIIPRVVSTYPSEGQKSVDVHHNIIIDFSEIVNVKNAYIKLVDSKGDVVNAAVDNRSASTWAHIRPYAPLQPDTEYTVTLPYNYVTNLSDNNMAFDYTMSFTTGANSLNIGKIYPTSIYENTGAPLSSSVEIEFSSPIGRGPEFDNIEISDSAGNLVSFELEETDKKVVLKPSMNLNPAEAYSVYIPAGAYKNESNDINDALNFKFAAAGRLGLNGATFVPEPSARWMVNKPLTFDTEWIERQFERANYNITSFEWSFGDGRPGSGKSPEHVYGSAGEYNVTLRLQDHKGVTYNFEQKVTIEDYKSSDVRMSVEAYHSMGIPLSTYFEEPLYTDGASNANDYRFYKIYLSQNDRPIPDEIIKVQLYKNGILQKDLGNVTTAEASKYTNTFGKEFVVGGGAGYRFWYDGKGYLGDYELAFVYGRLEEGRVVRVPITIEEAGEKRTLRVKLYSKDSGKFVEYPETMGFEVDGEKKYAKLEWHDAVDGYCYSIKDVHTSQLHTVKLAGDGWIRYSSDTESVWNNQTKIILPVKGRLPGITRIKSDYFDTDEGYRTGFFIAGVYMPPVTFEVEADWTGLTPGYYEVSTNTNSVKWTSAEPRIELRPGYDLKVGEGLYVRMVSREGIRSDWMGVNVTVVPKPNLGLGFNLAVSYREGKYRIDGPIEFQELMGGSISLLNGVPLLDNDKGFGLGNGDHKFDGQMSTSFTRAYFDIDFASDFTYGEEKEKKRAKSKVVSTGYEISTEMYGGIWLVYDRGSQDWEMEYGEITLLGDGNYYWKKGYTIPKIGIGADARLTMGAVVGGTLIIDRTEDSEREYSGILYFDPYVKVSIEAGVKGLSVEGYVEGHINGQVHIPTGYVEAEPNITAGIKATAFLYSETLYKKSIVNEHWDNGKEKISMKAFKIASEQLMTELDTEYRELAPMPRNYLNRESEWLAGGKSTLTMGKGLSYSRLAAEKTNPEMEIMKENIYPEAEVQLVRNGDELWMVWADDNPERDSMNRTQMRYAVLKDSLWSEPVWIGQDGTADFNPVSAATGNGVLMAWQNMKRTIGPDDGLLSFVENAEISVIESVYKADGGDVQIVRLTDDDKMDHSPRLAANGDNALLVWIKSEGLGFTMGTDEEEPLSPENSDRLVFSSWDGSTWSTPEEIEGSLPSVIKTNLTMHGESGLLLYTLDMDNDQSTQEDEELFARIYDGDSWEDAIRITDNDVSDSNSKAVYYNGEWFITWQQDGSLMYKAGLDGETDTEEALSSLQSSYEIAVSDGEKPQIALVYKHIGDNSVRTLSTSFYDVENDTWSQEIPLTEENGYVRAFSPVFAEDGKLNIAYTQAEIITEVIDGDEYLIPSDKVDLHLLMYTPVHDLELSSEDGLQISPANPRPGTKAVVSATIRNQGDFAESATLYLYDGEPGEGVKLGEATTAQPIPARSSALVEVEWIVDSEEREEYNIYAVVQPDAGITETDETNNMISLQYKTADIVVVSLEYEHLAKDEYLVTAVIANVGAKSLEHIKIQFDQGEIEQFVERSELEQLDAGRVEGVSFLISSSELEKDESGDVNLVLRALLPEAVEEYSTENNTNEFVLEPASIVVDKMNPAPGETKVDIHKPLTLTFNMNVEEGDGFEQIVLQDDNLNSIDLNKSLEGNTLTVTPQSTMAYDTQYTLIIPKAAIGDSYGHSMEDDYSLSFVTTSSSPEIVFAYPGNEMDSVELAADIKMQFNQAILSGPTYGDIAMHGPDSKLISAEVALQGEWLYIHPIGQLDENMQYSLMVPRGAVKNDKGEAQQEDFTLEFTTAKAEVSGNNDNDSDESDTGQPTSRPDSEKQDYNISRQISDDGSSTAIVDIGKLDIMKLRSGNEPVITLDITDKVKEDEKVEMNVSQSVLKQLMTNQLGLNLVTGKGNVMLPAEVIKSLTGEDKSPITIIIAQSNKQVIDNDRVSAYILDFSINAGDRPVTEFESKVIVTIPLDKSKVRNAKRIIVCVFDENTGSWIPVGGVADATNGSVTFGTRHFSTYAAFETIKHFDDVTSSWAKEKVELLASRRLIEGKSNNFFAPDDSITRAEFAAMIVRSLYTELSKSKGTFEDVPDDAWFTASVETAYEKGLVSGNGPAKFDPNSQISREQLATIAYRLYQYKAGTDGIDKTSTIFKDKQDISSYAVEAVNFVANTKIMIGSGDKFEPGRGATRQETAVVLYRLLSYMGEL